MPNIATDFAIIALTLFVIDQAQRRDEKHRKWPLLNWTLSQIASALARFAIAAKYDYTKTHGTNYQRPPDPIPEALTHWKNGLVTTDIPREREEFDAVIRAADLLKDELNPTAVRDLDNPDLLVAMSNFVLAARGANADAHAIDNQDFRHVVDTRIGELAETGGALATEFDRFAKQNNVRQGRQPSAADYVAQLQDTVLQLKLIELEEHRPGGLKHDPRAPQLSAE